MIVRDMIRNLKETNLIERDPEQQEWQIQTEESILLHLKSSWQTEECNESANFTI